MIGDGSVLSDRQANWAFGLGCIAVTGGVVLHLPMFAMARDMGYRLAGMPMEPAMLVGMAAIILGVAAAGIGLLPRNVAAQRALAASIEVAAPEDARLGPAHFRLMGVLTLALVIDVMKPASLGFTVPGMASEYGVAVARVSLVPFFALLGTVVGSLVWGVLADVYGRKATILLSAVMFVGTSICGAMPSLAWNIGMCFLMGAAAGGMLPVTYALLAEMMPNRHRGWSLVLVGGLGAVGGYFAASGLSAVLQPVFGWRALWLANLPTGLLLVLLGTYIPESAKFLLARGRKVEAEAVMRRFGAVATRALPAIMSAALPMPGGMVGKLAALGVAAIAWGLVNFGLLLWLPADLVARGYSIGALSGLLAKSSLIALPTVFLVAWLYHRWSTKWTLVAMLGLVIAGLVGVLGFELAAAGSILLPISLLIIGSNGLLAALLPYAAESFPLAIRGRATGWVAACTKAGGLIAQALAITAMVPTMALVCALTIVPALLAMLLVSIVGRETRGSDLAGLEPAAT